MPKERINNLTNEVKMDLFVFTEWLLGFSHSNLKGIKLMPKFYSLKQPTHSLIFNLTLLERKKELGGAN